MTTQPIQFETPDRGEETARADFYGLLASLFYAPPPRGLLSALSQARAPEEGALQQAWNELAAQANEANEQALREEYESLFIGVGKPEVMLYGSFYLSGFLMEKPLAALRTDLSELGLERDESMPESEDHIAVLCEVMRYLITSDDVIHASLATQKRFFATHVQPWVSDMCDAIERHPQAGFYASVARLTRRFFEVEIQAFDMA